MLTQGDHLYIKYSDSGFPVFEYLGLTTVAAYTSSGTTRYVDLAEFRLNFEIHDGLVFDRGIEMGQYLGETQVHHFRHSSDMEGEIDLYVRNLEDLLLCPAYLSPTVPLKDYEYEVPRGMKFYKINKFKSRDVHLIGMDLVFPSRTDSIGKRFESIMKSQDHEVDMLPPIDVTFYPRFQKFEINNGNHRFFMSQELRMTHIPAKIVNRDGVNLEPQLWPSFDEISVNFENPVVLPLGVSPLPRQLPIPVLPVPAKPSSALGESV